jgi:hypothetical protein
MGIWISWHMKIHPRDWEHRNCCNLRLVKRAPLCCNWNPTSSSINTSCLERLVPIFIGHMLETTGQSSTYFLFPLIQRLMSSCQNQNLYSTLSVERYSFFNSLYVEAGVLCLPVPILVLLKVYVLACITKHLLVELAGIRTICQWEEEQPISNIDVVCVTLCFSETKDPSIHALLTLVLGRRME